MFTFWWGVGWGGVRGVTRCERRRGLKQLLFRDKTNRSELKPTRPEASGDPHNKSNTHWEHHVPLLGGRRRKPTGTGQRQQSQRDPVGSCVDCSRRNLKGALSSPQMLIWLRREVGCGSAHTPQQVVRQRGSRQTATLSKVELPLRGGQRSSTFSPHTR